MFDDYEDDDFDPQADLDTDSEEMGGFESKFNEDFQMRILAYSIKDPLFLRLVHSMFTPNDFSLESHSFIAKMVKQHFEKYGTAPSITIIRDLIRQKRKSGEISDEMILELKEDYNKIKDVEIADTVYMTSELTEFAQNRALLNAISQSIELLETNDLDGIKQLINKASLVGKSSVNDSYDFLENVENRFTLREEEAMGKSPKMGITTGFPKLDGYLYHQGWGRREFALLMGGAKAGKSIGLGHFSMSACLAGYNVLYVTLELHKEIVANRLDALLSKVSMQHLTKHRAEVKSRVHSLMQRCGQFKINQFPTGTFTASDLRRLLEDYKVKGVTIDFVALDYIDLCKPEGKGDDHRTLEKIMYGDFRAIADEYNVALLSATQTNRSGMGFETARATEVSDNIEKVRICDLMISINATEEEKEKNEARLFFAASRNQAGGHCVTIKQDLETMQFIERLIL